MHRRRELWALLAVQLLFGSLGTAGRLALRSVDVRGLMFLRISGAALLFWFLWLLGAEGPRAERTRFSAREWGLLVICAALGIALNQLFFINGLALSGAIHSSVVSTGTPVFVLALAVLSRSEDLTLGKGLGIALALLGAVSLVGLERFQHSSQSLGDLLLVASSICFASYLVLTRSLRRHSPLCLTRWTFTLGGLLLVPYALAGPWFVAPPSPAIWALLAYIVLGPTFLTYLFNTFALRRVEPSRVAVFIYLQPLVAVCLAVTLLDEKVTVRLTVSALLIFLGVLLANRLGRTGPVLEGS